MGEHSKIEWKARHPAFDKIALAERFFAAIKPGDTPETSQFSKLAVEWIDEWLNKMRAAFVPVSPVGK